MLNHKVGFFLLGVLILVFGLWVFISGPDLDTPITKPSTNEQKIAQIPQHPLPRLETEDFSAVDSDNNENGGDIADDTVIWANPATPDKSLVIATNKSKSGGGIAVFDMRGKMIQYQKLASLNNVDLRPGFRFNGEEIILVGANNQTDNTLEFWVLDPSTQKLSRLPTARKLKTTYKNYGFCMYANQQKGKIYGFVSEDDGNHIEQYEIFDDQAKINTRKVRDFTVGKSQSEGCVADDAQGYYYTAEELGSLWRFRADPDQELEALELDSVAVGNLTGEIEGMSLAIGPGSAGYLVVSDQGSSRFAVYERKSGKFIRTFRVAANGQVDQVDETDGLDISLANLGPGFEKGMLVVHDHANSGGKTSNHKYIPLQ